MAPTGFQNLVPGLPRLYGTFEPANSKRETTKAMPLNVPGPDASPADTQRIRLSNDLSHRILNPNASKPVDKNLAIESLKKIANELPSHYFCSACSMLHAYKIVAPPSPALHQSGTSGQYPEESLAKYVSVHQGSQSGHRFEYARLQEAMKRYIQGPEHGISTESLSYIEVCSGSKAPCITPETSFTTLLSVDARISCEPTLCLRLQNWALAKPKTFGIFIEHIEKFVGLCPHINIRTYRQHILNLMSEAKDAADRAPPTLFTCVKCCMDYQFQVVYFSDAGFALFVTKWLDLGAGADPTDVKWKRHVDITVSNPEPRPVRGRSCWEFDGTPGDLSTEELTEKNASRLLGNWYKGTLDWWDDGTWVLRGGTHLPLNHPRARGVMKRRDGWSGKDQVLYEGHKMDPKMDLKMDLKMGPKKDPEKDPEMDPEVQRALARLRNN
ncbi:hypothetical protein FQN51_003129 [Onygenales sp. PD_10]|nr:hypothetical protein FQN51_003129 [Onygenales sp. PD_10]